jgi:hypothetical protein
VDARQKPKLRRGDRETEGRTAEANEVRCERREARSQNSGVRDLGDLGGSDRVSGAVLQCELLPGAIEPSDKVTEEIAPKKYFGALGEQYPQITQIT